MSFNFRKHKKWTVGNTTLPQVYYSVKALFSSYLPDVARYYMHKFF